MDLQLPKPEYPAPGEPPGSKKEVKLSWVAISHLAKRGSTHLAGGWGGTLGIFTAIDAPGFLYPEVVYKGSPRPTYLSSGLALTAC